MRVNLSMMFVVLLGVLTMSGCGGVNPGKRAEPTKFNGTITDSEGKPVSDVTLQFLPQFLGSIQTAAKVGSDGKFTIDLLPGKYAYMIEPVKGKDAAFKKVPEKYKNADKDVIVDVLAGQDISIKLAN